MSQQCKYYCWCIWVSVHMRLHAGEVLPVVCVCTLFVRLLPLLYRRPQQVPTSPSTSLFPAWFPPLYRWGWMHQWGAWQWVTWPVSASSVSQCLTPYIPHQLWLAFYVWGGKEGGSCCTVDIGAPYMPCWLTVVCCLQGMPDRMLCAVLEQFQLYFSRWYVCFVSVWVCLYMTVEHKEGFFFIWFHLNLFYLYFVFIYLHPHFYVIPAVVRKSVCWHGEDREWSSRQVSPSPTLCNVADQCCVCSTYASGCESPRPSNSITSKLSHMSPPISTNNILDFITNSVMEMKKKTKKKNKKKTNVCSTKIFMNC